jgi:hypothetical protein
MASYSVSLLAVPAQSFSVQLGKNLLKIKIQWMPRVDSFRIDISKSNDAPVTSGRFLNVGVDLLAGLYPAPEEPYGSLILIGDEATPDNLGINNTLVYTNG